VIAVVVEFPGKSQGFGRAKFDAKTAALAAVPIDENLATKLASSWRRGSLRHVNLDRERNFSTLRGTTCLIMSPTALFSISMSILTVPPATIAVFSIIGNVFRMIG
jgi:hypothetical protein